MIKRPDKIQEKVYEPNNDISRISIKKIVVEYYKRFIVLDGKKSLRNALIGDLKI
jgi:hypothetical protein